ncbi:hypothetical protein [Inquilinus sp. OTU3971]|uniref:hypothetical protein n=1 Tax=Inquilinus sp. OTU3971 TaxID=3043855 RepID=UPI00313B2B6A
MHHCGLGRVLYLPPSVQTAGTKSVLYDFVENTASDESSWNKIQHLKEDFFSIEDQVAWERWLLSHHLSFLLWLLAIDELTLCELEAVDVPTRITRIERVGTYLNGYGAALTYARMITQEQYAQQIRPFMNQYYPGFSATWAEDYQILKRKIGIILRDDTLGRSVRASFRETVQEHIRTAQDLVPSGPSLLKEILAANSDSLPALGASHFAYDSLFLVRRCRVPKIALATQLSYRVAATARDVQSRPLPDHVDPKAATHLIIVLQRAAASAWAARTTSTSTSAATSVDT